MSESLTKLLDRKSTTKGEDALRHALVLATLACTWVMGTNAPATITVAVYVTWILIGLLVWTKHVQRQRKQNRALRGLCVNCGYDIRSCSGRCSECGTEIGL